MSASRMIAAMDEVATLLRSHDWSGVVDVSQLGGATGTVTVSREYQPAHSLEGIRGCLVDVYPLRKLRERVARGVWAETFMLAIGMQAPLPARNPKSAADQWMALADAITDFVTAHNYSFGAIEKLEELPTVDVGQIDADHVFSRVLMLTIRSNQVIQ